MSAVTVGSTCISPPLPDRYLHNRVNGERMPNKVSVMYTYFTVFYFYLQLQVLHVSQGVQLTFAIRGVPCLSNMDCVFRPL